MSSDYSATVGKGNAENFDQYLSREAILKTLNTYKANDERFRICLGVESGPAGDCSFLTHPFLLAIYKAKLPEKESDIAIQLFLRDLDLGPVPVYIEIAAGINEITEDELIAYLDDLHALGFLDYLYAIPEACVIKLAMPDPPPKRQRKAKKAGRGFGS